MAISQFSKHHWQVFAILQRSMGCCLKSVDLGQSFHCPLSPFSDWHDATIPSQ